MRMKPGILNHLKFSSLEYAQQEVSGFNLFASYTLAFSSSAYLVFMKCRGKLAKQNVIALADLAQLAGALSCAGEGHGTHLAGSIPRAMT